jgi:membrane-associated phospholipid phosphatase
MGSTRESANARARSAFLRVATSSLLVLALSACGTVSPPGAKVVANGMPVLAVGLSTTLTSVVSQQRLSALTAARLYGYSFYAAQEAFLGELKLDERAEDLAVIAAVHAATKVAREILSNAKAPGRELDTLERRYASNPSEEGLQAATRGDVVAEELIQRSRLDGYSQAGEAEQPEPVSDDWVWEPTGTMRMPFIEPGYGTIKPLIDGTSSCSLPAPSIDVIKAESMELFKNFDPAAAAGEEVLLFLAGNGTPTPAGQMLIIAANAARSNKLDQSSAMALLSAVAIAGNDAGIAVWREKAKHMIARPETIYSRATGNQALLPRETPAHPSYPSGHSGFSGSAVEIMISLLGEQTKMKLVAPEDLAAPRVVFEFSSPRTLLRAVSASRVSAGFHTPTDVRAGEALGACVGQAVLVALSSSASEKGSQR